MAQKGQGNSDISSISYSSRDERNATRGQLFKTFNLDQNDPDLEISFFPIQDQVIHLTFMPVFQSNIGLDHPDPDTQISRLPNPDYQSSKWDNISQCGLPAR